MTTNFNEMCLNVGNKSKAKQKSCKRNIKVQWSTEEEARHAVAECTNYVWQAKCNEFRRRPKRCKAAVATEMCRGGRQRTNRHHYYNTTI